MIPTATHIAYYFTCHRKLWLFHHGIQMEHTSDLVYEGKMIGEQSYDRRHSRFREIDLGHIKIDFYDPVAKVIHEIKKSKKLEKTHQWQLKFYIYESRKAGIAVSSGILEYPKAKITTRVQLEKEDEIELEKAIINVRSIIASTCPPVIEKRICKKCSYFEFCYSGEG